MYGNCFTFAICDFFRNGGELVISFADYKQIIPHFSVQRSDKVYDLEIVKMILYVFFYDGEPRTTKAEYYDHIKCKRFKIAKRRITTASTKSAACYGD